MFRHNILQNQIPALSMISFVTDSRTFTDLVCFQGLFRPWKSKKSSTFKDWQVPCMHFPCTLAVCVCAGKTPSSQYCLHCWCIFRFYLCLLPFSHLVKATMSEINWSEWSQHKMNDIQKSRLSVQTDVWTLKTRSQFTGTGHQFIMTDISESLCPVERSVCEPCT